MPVTEAGDLEDTPGQGQQGGHDNAIFTNFDNFVNFFFPICPHCQFYPFYPYFQFPYATIARSKIEKDYAKCNCSHQAKLDSPAVKVNNLGKKLFSSKNILYLD